MQRIGIIALVCALGLAACGGSGPAIALQEFAYASLGELQDAIEAAEASPVPDESLDSDEDSIPDTIELEIGTDPFNRDSDRDGLVDNFELFGVDFDRLDRLPDRDFDGLIAPVDADDDGDGRNDGDVIDTDGDGVANYLEFYGYTYDFLTGWFQPWNGDESVEHFVTDPLQPSTDQDAYPDGMEASGALLDPTVRGPGNDPLVPAYPNLVFELAGYSVTLNHSIQVTESESMAEGRTWSRQTSSSHSYTDQSSWELGAKVGYKAGPTGGVEGEVSANYGQSYANTNTTSTTVATGDSIVSANGWSRARSSNPTDAARIKLFIKVHNRGTAPISSVIPTLTLKIGGRNVATFEPGNAQINMLVPGATYPEEAGVFWVVDSIDTGNTVSPLSLTMAELRALERGAPIAISLTQVLGDVMRLAPGGVWERIGDTNQYVARCDAVCANLRIDLGDGTFVHHLVYADDSSSAPRMTLGVALRKIGVDEDGTLLYHDSSGAPVVRSLDGFDFVFDPETLRANGWTLAGDGAPDTVPPEGFVLAEMRLLPGSNVLIRAPRDPQMAPGPEIHFAYFDPFSGEVKVSAADYAGIATVTVVNEDGSKKLDLFEDIPGAGFYSGVARAEDGFDDSDVLRVIVTNLAGDSLERDLGRLYKEPEPQAPRINAITLDQDTRYLYANVESGNPDHPNSDIAWVRVFHPGLTATGGVLELERVVNYYEDPHGYFVVLPVGFNAIDLEVVAFVEEGVYTSRFLDPEDVTKVEVLRLGTLTLNAETKDSTGIAPGGGALWVYTTAMMTMDAQRDSDVVRRSSALRPAFSQPPAPGNPVDAWVRVKNILPGGGATIAFNLEYARLPGADYRTLTKAEIVAAAPSSKASLEVGTQGGLRVNDVFAVRTTEGKYGKLKVSRITFGYSVFRQARSVSVELRYVTFK